jgi:hypothetical protein
MNMSNDHPLARDIGRPSLLLISSEPRESVTDASSVRETKMDRHTKIKRLRNTLDEAITCAEQAGLAFVVLILDMARLEVDQSTASNGGIPTANSFGKRS